MSAVDAANEALDDQVESLEDVLARHRREVRELDTKARFMLKAAKKGRGSEAEAEVYSPEPSRTTRSCPHELIAAYLYMYVCSVLASILLRSRGLRRR
jgi:hypothetical protein